MEATIASAAEPSDSTILSPVMISVVTNRDFGVLQIAVGNMLVDQFPDPVMRNEEIPAPQEAEHRSHRQRENILAPQAAPDRLQLQDTLERRIAGIIGAVDGADAGADHHVGGNAVRGERMHHADLDGAEAAAAGEDKGGFGVARMIGYGQGGLLLPASARW